MADPQDLAVADTVQPLEEDGTATPPRLATDPRNESPNVACAEQGDLEAHFQTATGGLEAQPHLPTLPVQDTAQPAPATTAGQHGGIAAQLEHLESLNALNTERLARLDAMPTGGRATNRAGQWAQLLVKWNEVQAGLREQRRMLNLFEEHFPEMPLPRHLRPPQEAHPQGRAQLLLRTHSTICKA